MAARIRASRQELADLETLDTGKPISQALTDVDVAARYFEFYGATVEALFGDTLPAEPGVLAYSLVEPYGVSGHIIPWNYPLQIAARTLAPALAVGNTCVLKPAEDAPLSSVRLAQLAFEAGLPPGALNVVPGYGREAGAALAGHPGIDHLSFTGSRSVGQAAMRAAAGNIVPVTLELGGKSPHLVFPDADLDIAADHIYRSITEHAGQNCSAGSRLIVHDQVHDELVGRLVRRFEAARISPGCSDPDIGPLISARQRDRVLQYLDRGRSQGCVVTGGSAPHDPALASGFYVLPTIFDEVDTTPAIAQEEIFGPVLCVHRFTLTTQALAIANNTTYGLSAGVWTRDIGLALALCRKLQAGQVFINNYSAAGGWSWPSAGTVSPGSVGRRGSMHSASSRAPKPSPSTSPTSCDISDACDRLGIPAVRTGSMRPMWPGCPPAIGRVATWRMAHAHAPADAAPLAAQLAALATVSADVLLVDLAGLPDVQCWGAVLATAARHWGVGAVLVNGSVRDIPELAAMKYPTYARGAYPARTQGRLRLAATGADVPVDGSVVRAGDMVAVDASGAVFFPVDQARRVLADAGNHAERERKLLDRVLAGEDPRAVLVGEFRESPNPR